VARGDLGDGGRCAGGPAGIGGDSGRRHRRGGRGRGVASQCFDSLDVGEVGVGSDLGADSVVVGWLLDQRERGQVRTDPAGQGNGSIEAAAGRLGIVDEGEKGLAGHRMVLFRFDAAVRTADSIQADRPRLARYQVGGDKPGSQKMRRIAVRASAARR
jgi:hypothetical protein